MKISYYTLGCKLNQAETEDLKKDLENAGFLTVPYDSGEDISIIRACGVTMGASQTSREMIRRAARGGAHVVAVGCLENKELKEIGFFAKNNQVAFRYITKKFPTKNKQLQSLPHKTRAMIKIQSGCNFNCAYCVIPSFRGKSQSVDPKKIITKIKEEEKQGRQEIVLTGINICQYNWHEIDLAGLLKEILTHTQIKRIRLGSLDPRLISDPLIGLFIKEARLLPHWHLSLQSGSDSVLKRMCRGYSSKDYFNMVKKIRTKNPLFSFTTDIIVGFPGETDEEFQETLNLIQKIGFTKIHVFPYSPRPNTVAEKLPGQIPDKIKTGRSRILRETAEATAKKFKNNFIGLTKPVLFEQKKNGVWSGYTPEYIQIKIKSSENLENIIKDTKLTKENLTLD